MHLYARANRRVLSKSHDTIPLTTAELMMPMMLAARPSFVESSRICRKLLGEGARTTPPLVQSKIISPTSIAICDRIAVLTFVAHSFGVYKDNLLWWSTLLFCGVIMCCNWLHIIKAPKSKSAAHACTHFALIAALLYLDAK